MKKLTSIFLFTLSFALFACKNKPAVSDILAKDLDTTVRPQDDFFQYANGGWLKNNPIPDAYKSWGIANLVQEDLYNRLKTINEEAVKKPGNAISKKIAAFWKSGMDSLAREKQSISILQPQLDMIASIKNTADLLKVSAQLSQIGVDAFFSSYVSQDDKNSSKMAFHFNQGGLGLPNRDYYFNNDARTKNIRDAYVLFIEKMLKLATTDSLSAKTQSVQLFNLEKSLATASRKLADLRDPYKNYHKLSIAQFSLQTPSVDWKSWLSEAGVYQIDSVIVGQPEFFVALDKDLQLIPIDQWKVYLKWNLIRDLGSYVNMQMETASFAFYGEVMNGLKAQKPMWKRVLGAEESSLGEALGQLFVKENFNAQAKKRYSDLVENIRDALKQRIRNLDWMTAATKEKALFKLSKMRKKVGYPDKWKDFSAMDIKEQPFVLNIIAANKWWNQYEIHKLNKPVDREEWDMTPQTYNAYYNPSNNEIVLPAGIFTVPGKKDNQLDDALVYGYAGASTIGHEMTHGFDDQGRQYDADGNLSNWWTKQDEIQFNKRAQVMVRQFDAYTPVDSVHINGSATLGENIADLGGILLGWDAFTKTDAYRTGKLIGGLTPAQRFFLGYALGWLYEIRPQALAQQLLTDVHSPAKYRVNGPFVDVDAFYKTFDVKPNDKMYLADSTRVHIW